MGKFNFSKPLPRSAKYSISVSKSWTPFYQDKIQNNLIFLFRMEVHGKPGRIQISANTKTILELTEAEGYAIKSRGRISVKVLICRLSVLTYQINMAYFHYKFLSLLFDQKFKVNSSAF